MELDMRRTRMAQWLENWRAEPKFPGFNSSVKVMNFTGMLCFLVLVLEVKGARILAIFPMPFKSHMILYSPFLEELVRRGHEITVISAYPRDTKLANFTDIVLPLSLVNREKKKSMDITARPTYLEYVAKFGEFSLHLSDKYLALPQIQELIHSNGHSYDLIIYEEAYVDSFLGFAHIFNAPIVKICSFQTPEWTFSRMGIPAELAYVPNYLLDCSAPMNIVTRMKNLFYGLFLRLNINLREVSKREAIMRKYFGPIPSIEELEKRVAVLLINTDLGLADQRPLLPSVIPIGGLHIRKQGHLNKTLQKFIDESPNGVIYMSMGTSLVGSLMPKENLAALLVVFSKLKQRIIWKWESKHMPDKPDNVKLIEWAPQQEILAHPNVKAFISQGGHLSTQEALYNGVPIIGLPVIGDQFYNMRIIVDKGCGVKIDFTNLTSSYLQTVIEQVLETPSYLENAKRMSRILRDQPESPIERAVFWTEYVIRHKGAAHLRSSSLDLYWFQYLFLDVLLIVVITLLACFALLKLGIHFVIRLVEIVSQSTLVQSLMSSKFEKYTREERTIIVTRERDTQ
uniref:UDP-glycosyltransferase n=1 Tax=Timema tahoe TaxID=61484 RepID=A0A7R9NWB4_9NEOP|nr:unnamed protein product [Timema tahoe]